MTIQSRRTGRHRRHGGTKKDSITYNRSNSAGLVESLALTTLALAIVVIASGIVLHMVNAGRPNADIEYAAVEVTVMPGDTLWGIARDYSSSEVDLRVVVDDIMRKNSLSSSVVRPGQVLRISVPIHIPTENQTLHDFHSHKLANAGT